MESETLNSKSIWINATDVDTVRSKGCKVIRHKGKQIAIFDSAGSFLACNNRCPHQGYPLSEGCLTDDGILTCNWHNWKFDLASGSNLKGSEGVRVYPLEVRANEIWIDVQDPPIEQQKQELYSSLRKAIEDNSYEHIARELCRLQLIGADLTDALSLAIEWSHDRLEYGWTHAYAGATDWLTLFDEFNESPEHQLICILEAIGHIADDSLRRPLYPYSNEVNEFDSKQFLEAIENENESRAISMIRGALEADMHFADLEESFSSAALAHYNDFGHALIYVSKSGDLIRRLGCGVELPVLLALTRTLAYTTREDQIPQFRHYGEVIDKWPTQSRSVYGTEWREFAGLSVDRAIDHTLDSSNTDPFSLYRTLLKANANNMLHFDLDLQHGTTNLVDDNVSWLGFTHTITFANAVRQQCTKFPQLWAPGLLQMACFSGRNQPYVDLNNSQNAWFANDSDSFFSDAVDRLFDHGKEEFIVSVHLLKTILAARTECQDGDAESRNLITAAMNRFLNSPLKRKHVLRTARQAMHMARLEY